LPVTNLIIYHNLSPRHDGVRNAQRYITFEENEANRCLAIAAFLSQEGHLGNPEEFTIRQMAEIVVDITGSASKIVHRPLPTDDPKYISKAQELLGWRPTVPLRVGLAKTAAYFEGLLAREAAIAVAV
jgi:nucleoside-diphosphate-sugar epimerase